MGTISQVDTRSPLRAYAEAGVLGAVAAICVLAILVVAGGMVVAGCPAGRDGLANCFGGPQVQAESLAAQPQADPAPAGAAATGQPIQFEANQPSALPANQPATDLASTPAAPTAADVDTAAPAAADENKPVAVAEAVTNTSAEPPAAVPGDERLTTTLPAIADSLPMNAPGETHPAVTASVSPSGGASETAAAKAKVSGPSAVDAARLEAVPTDPGAKTASGEDSHSELAYADTAVATDLDTTPPGGPRVGPRAVNLHVAASAASAHIGTLKANEALTAKAQKQGWVQVADADGNQGWVDADYLAGVDVSALPKGDDTPPVKVASAETPAPAEAAPAAAEPSASAIRFVAGQGVNVRSGAGTSNGKLFALKGGSKVTLTGQDDHGWLLVTDAQGRKGWIYKDYLLSK